MDLKNKVVLITGTSTGIGRAAALAFAKKGAKLALVSRNKEKNNQLMGEIHASGGTSIFIPTDVSDLGNVKHAIAETLNRYGRLDIAINNAGIEGTPRVKAADYDIEVWDRLMDVNLKGVWLCIKYQLQTMMQNGGGRIINISSLAGLRGGDAGVAYHASKFGVIGLTKTIALEYADKNIRVNAICPAVIETPMAERAFSDPVRMKDAINMHPVGRFGRVNEVVGAIMWLASSDADFITGAAIPVDGGAGV
ncbi:glucose 1-dehydrogenase [Seonamhaeicola sp.]|uniref:SDR family NAD(P)-dependent oxidoreductase n=1 Tax=Seonamhaeicola sp. TaxID=1912245 RepID=UPI002606A082|nr:glucose 1-dehydrogenase [Seonamhaeicola sp.]